jgi:hypothetical protein
MKIKILSAVVAVWSGAVIFVSPMALAEVLVSENFNKAFLGDVWEVKNDSSDMRALDDGKLSIVTELGNFSKGQVKNLMFLKKPLTAKNVDITVKLDADIQEYGGNWNKRFFAGLAVQPEQGTYLMTYLTNFGASYNSDTGPYAIYSKNWKGKSRALNFHSILI